MATMLPLLLHFILSTIFGIYVRLRKLYHALFDRVSAVLNYHHRTPERKQPLSPCTPPYKLV